MKPALITEPVSPRRMTKGDPRWSSEPTSPRSILWDEISECDAIRSRHGAEAATLRSSLA